MDEVQSDTMKPVLYWLLQRNLITHLHTYYYVCGDKEELAKLARRDTDGRRVRSSDLETVREEKDREESRSSTERNLLGK